MIIHCMIIELFDLNIVLNCLRLKSEKHANLVMHTFLFISCVGEWKERDNQSMDLDDA